MQPNSLLINITLMFSTIHTLDIFNGSLVTPRFVHRIKKISNGITNLGQYLFLVWNYVSLFTDIGIFTFALRTATTHSHYSINAVIGPGQSRVPDKKPWPGRQVLAGLTWRAPSARQRAADAATHHSLTSCQRLQPGKPSVMWRASDTTDCLYLYTNVGLILVLGKVFVTLCSVISNATNNILVVVSIIARFTRQ